MKRQVAIKVITQLGLSQEQIQQEWVSPTSTKATTITVIML